MRKLLALIPILLFGLVLPFSVGLGQSASAAPRPVALGFYAGPHNGTIGPSDYAALGKPAVAIYYAWDFTAPVAPFLAQTGAQGITPFVELQTGSEPLSSVAAGDNDADIVATAKAIKANGRHVDMTFDHEMNGSWKPWNGSPTDWIRAWNHVTKVIDAGAPGLVTWIWAPNVDGGATAARPWWRSGSQFVLRVNEIGLDGYLCITQTTGSCSQSFASVFATSVSQIRQYTKLPMVVSETGIGPPGNRPAELRAMANTARAEGFQGMYWFDQDRFTLTAAQEKILATALR